MREAPNLDRDIPQPYPENSPETLPTGTTPGETTPGINPGTVPRENPNLVRFADLYRDFLGGAGRQTDDNGDLSLFSSGKAGGNSQGMIVVFLAVAAGIGYFIYKRKKHL